MSDFYRNFISIFFNKLSSQKSGYKSFVRNRLPVSLKIVYYFETALDWFVRKLSRGSFYIALLRKDNFFIDSIKQFENTNSLLCDQDSKNKYAEYISYRAIDTLGTELNVDHLDIKNDLKAVSNYEVNSELLSTKAEWRDWRVFDLSKIGYDVKIINNSIGVLIDFVYEQYAYKDLIRICKDDIVIDCGGAIGDTAIYFLAKEASKVYVSEFIESNIELINKQLELNPKFKNKVHVLSKPVWSVSNLELSYLDKGNASKVDSAGKYPNTITTTTIDEIVVDHGLERVDFIKMDIEGAELPALIGAEETINKYKPKLAVCVYHKKNDLIEIPSHIHSLNPGYEFYFDFYTDVGWEAVLYAVDRNSI